MEFSRDNRFVLSCVFQFLIFSMLIVLQVTVVYDSQDLIHTLYVLDTRIELRINKQNSM